MQPRNEHFLTIEKSPAEIEAEIYGEQYYSRKKSEQDPLWFIERRIESIEDALLPPLSPPQDVGGQQKIDRPQDVVGELWSRSQWRYVQQLMARVNYLEAKLNRHLDRIERKHKDYL